MAENIPSEVRFDSAGGGDCRIRPIVPADAAAIADIYNHYILSTVITFEEEAVTAPQIAARIEEVRRADLPWLVAESDGVLLGYANATKWKGRCAYRHSAESGIYLASEATGRGIGTRLYRELLAALARRGVHAVIAGIALPNPASIALHEKCGFGKIGHFREVGFKFERWIDVGYWQLLADRKDS
ncbi:MAG TPA: arsinothricin resistance N-acetyltransferase ArsN1 family B [Gammaproteobacteria bacterium]|nr:arsinothricin resistance N-acetyltransferase ArsN1 family B [Gammaproteobacteria bacterium]